MIFKDSVFSNNNNEPSLLLHYDINIGHVKSLAENIAKNLKIGNIIALQGDLGVGKTTFSRFLINCLIPNEVITSPTYNIVNTYNYNKFVIWHFDLYRINNLDELIELNIDEAFNTGISIIEWPEIVLNSLTNYYSNIKIIKIMLSYSDKDINLRNVKIIY